MGVQLGVTGPGFPMIKRGGDSSADRDVGHAVAAGPGAYGPALEPDQGVLHGAVMRREYLIPDVLRAERPQDRDRLRNAERQVEPGDGVTR
ncbi:hypothetical protein GCM10023063_41500 [Arthrobacter methylotrophus]